MQLCERRRLSHDISDRLSDAMRKIEMLSDDLSQTLRAGEHLPPRRRRTMSPGSIHVVHTDPQTDTHTDRP